MNAASSRRRAAAAVGTLAAIIAGAALAPSAGAQAGSADLAVTSTDSADPVRTGETIEYAISVVNLGPDTAATAELEDKLPKGTDFISATPSQGNCASKGRKVTCQFGEVPIDPYGPVEVQLLVAAPSKAGTVTNVATVSSDTPDPVSANDTAEQTTTVVAADQPTCRGEVATIVGSPAGEILRGTPGRDVIVAGRGADTIRAKGGNDIVCAGAGADKLRGADGNDLLIGGNGRDRISGQAGNDELRGGRKADRLRGGAGNDTLKAGKGRDRCNGGAGKDVKRSC